MLSYKGYVPGGQQEWLLAALVIVVAFVLWSYFSRMKAVRAYIEAFGTDESRKLFKTDQAWREKDTGIRYLENLKTDLKVAEEEAKKGWETALLVHRRGGWAFTRVEPSIYIDIVKKRSVQLDRLWVGDVHDEVENWNDELRRLNREDGSHEERERAERAIRDLEEAKRRAVQRAAVSPNRAKWQEDQEVHGIDRESRIHRSFEGVNTNHAAYKMRQKLRQQFEDDETLSETERRKLFAQIDAAARAVEEASKAEPKKKSTSPYEDDE